MHAAASEAQRPTHIRWVVLAVMFFVTAFSYGDRLALSIAGIGMQRQMHLSPVDMGWLFSGFSWAYVAAQLPAGGLLDRFNTKRVYGISIFAWSCCALLVGCTGGLTPAMVFSIVLGLRLFSGLAQAPVFPGNGRLVAAWFPSTERGLASAIFNSAQYFSVVLFAPAMAAMTQHWGWRTCFWALGAIGFVLGAVWFRTIFEVRRHPWINAAEIALIEYGGAVTRPNMHARLTWAAVSRLLRQRMLVGIYLGQFCIVSLTWFFLTWFPVYLAQARGLSILQVGFYSTLPALCGFAGGIAGGAASDRLLAAGRSLTFARKVPIVFGMTLSTAVLLCNYANSRTTMIVLMSLAFFGKGFGALGWTLVADTSPQGRVGLNGGLFNLIGNTAGITTPLVIGYLLKRERGSFHGALIFVAMMAVAAMVALVPVAGTLRRVELPEE